MGARQATDGCGAHSTLYARGKTTAAVLHQGLLHVDIGQDVHCALCLGNRAIVRQPRMACARAALDHVTWPFAPNRFIARSGSDHCNI